MKKNYISPTVVVFDVDVENICTITASQQYRVTFEGDSPMTYDPNDTETDFAAPTYRTNLWN